MDGGREEVTRKETKEGKRNEVKMRTNVKM